MGINTVCGHSDSYSTLKSLLCGLTVPAFNVCELVWMTDIVCWCQLLLLSDNWSPHYTSPHDSPSVALPWHKAGLFWLYSIYSWLLALARRTLRLTKQLYRLQQRVTPTATWQQRAKLYKQQFVTTSIHFPIYSAAVNPGLKEIKQNMPVMWPPMRHYCLCSFPPTQRL